MKNFLNTIQCKDTLQGLKSLPTESVECIITSPPYWGLRNYDVKGQIGLEKTPEKYIQHLLRIFQEAKRILKKSGTCFVNLGDTYGGTGKKNDLDPKNKAGRNVRKNPPGRTQPQKSLCLIPFRFAEAMRTDGWIIRNVIIWHKPNAMPENVEDRFTQDFEYIFFFTKSKQYYFQQQFEDALQHRWGGNTFSPKDKIYKNEARIKIRERLSMMPEKRNKRCVWSVPTVPFPDAHFAVYPVELIESLVLAGCPKGGIICDPFMGSGTTAVVATILERNFIGFDIKKEYVKMAQKRVKPYLEQTRISIS